jgi:hypothetical protein
MWVSSLHFVSACAEHMPLQCNAKHDKSSWLKPGNAKDRSAAALQFLQAVSALRTEQCTLYLGHWCTNKAPAAIL